MIGSRLLVTAWAILVAQAALAAEKQSQSPIAFVGRFVAIEKLECESREYVDESTGENVIEVCGDSLFRATYEVEKVLEGNLTVGEHVVFDVADHYGFPPFAEHLRALLYLAKTDEGLWHIKYQWDDAYRTVDGDFAACGCDVDLNADFNGRKLEPPATCLTVNFSPPVTIDMTHMSPHYATEIRGSGDFSVQGNTATCIRGIAVEDAYRRRLVRLVEYLKD